MNFGSLIAKLKAFIEECRRVLLITKKPTSDEFKTIVKVSGIGMLIIGVIGFIIQMFYLIIIKGG